MELAWDCHHLLPHTSSQNDSHRWLLLVSPHLEMSSMCLPGRILLYILQESLLRVISTFLIPL